MILLDTHIWIRWILEDDPLPQPIIDTIESSESEIVVSAISTWEVVLLEKLGAVQDEDSRSGIPYARWPESILSAKALKDSIDNLKGIEKPKTESDKMDSFRHKFEAKHRSTDGHFVRSKAEMLIDNWLYMAEIVHAYERKLPIEEVYSDFYIPTGKVYIEFWGYDNDEKYLARKQQKQAIYQKYNFNLIECMFGMFGLYDLIFSIIMTCSFKRAWRNWQTRWI